MLLMKINITQLAARLNSQVRIVGDDIAEIVESFGLTWSMQHVLSDEATADDSLIDIVTIVTLDDTTSLSELFDTINSYAVASADTATASETHVHGFTLGNPNESVTATDSAPTTNETNVQGDTATAEESYSSVITFVMNTLADSATAAESSTFVLMYDQRINGATINQRTIG